MLEAAFFARRPQVVARELIGCLLVSEIMGRRTSGIIVETESYLAKQDSACHGARGLTPKTEVMFGPAARAYVYPIHAKYCFNVVTESPGRPSAVLIRALEPVDGIDVMRRRRSMEDETTLVRGPARLCQALGIDRRHNGLNLTLGKTLWIEPRPRTNETPGRIRKTIRIGVTSAHDLRLRCVLAGSRFASGPRKLR